MSSDVAWSAEGMISQGLSAASADVARSLSYRAFAMAFSYPDREGLNAIRAGSLADTLRRLVGGAAPQLLADTDWDALRDAGVDDESLLVEFTRLFEAGAEGPDCPLNGGQYRGGAMESLEELVRFYDFFGLSCDQLTQGEPDHLVTELEFLHFLSFQEARLGATGDDVTGVLLAQRDFIQRHPGAWVPTLRERLLGTGAPRFFCELASLLERFLQAEEARLASIPHGCVQ